MLLANRTALVTGANRGLGAAFVDALLERGVARVYAATRDGSLVADPARDPRVVPVQLDLTRPDQIEVAAREVHALDLLINNAGVLRSYNLLTDDFQQLQDESGVNFIGTLRVTRAFLPQLEAAQSAVVNVLTLVALASLATMGGYSASKAAAYSMTQALRVQLAPRGVAVQAVFPVAIDTEMIRHLQMPKTSPAEVARNILSGIEAGEADIFPDPMSRQLAELWQSDPHALEATFAQLANAA